MTGTGPEPGIAGSFSQDRGNTALLCGKASDLTDDQERGAADAFFFHEEWQLGERAEDAQLLGTRAVLDNGDRRFGGAAGGDELLGDHRRGIDTHEDDDRLRRARKRGPVKIRHAAFLGMAGNEGERLGMVAVGERDAGSSGAAERRGNAGHDMNFDAFSADGFKLFTAPAEDERVAPFEAHDTQPFLGRGDEAGMDFGLGHGMIALRLADRNAGRIAADEGDYLRADEAVVIDHIGFLDEAEGFQRQKFRIAGSGANDVDDTAGAAGDAGLLAQEGFGAFKVSGIGGLGGGAGKGALPIAAAGGFVRDRFGHKAAQRAGEFGQIADPLGQQGLKLGTDGFGEHGRGAARTDGGDDLAPVQNGGNGEIAIFRLVDDVDRNAPSADGGEGGGAVTLVFLGDDDKASAFQRGRDFCSRERFDASSELRCQGQVIKAAHEHDLCAGPREQTQLARRFLAAAKDDDPGAFEVKEGRELAHGRNFLIRDTTGTNIQNLLDASDATGNPYSDHLEKLSMSDPSDRLPPLNALRAFEAAARRLSFTQAAEELNVTPGAISQQIRQLEDFAGTPLFKRTGRSVLLTDAAQASLPLVREAFDRIAEAGRVMQAPARKGRVMVSSAPSFAAKWLAPRLERFQLANEGIEAWISADMSLTDFNTADADIAIRYGRGSYDGLKSEKLMDETVLPVCAPRLLEGPNAILKPEDLRHHTLLHDESSENDPSCPDWTSWLRAHGVTGVDGTRGPRFNQGILVIESAAAGRGVALAKQAIAAADLEAGRLVAPFASGSTPIDFGYWLVWPKGRHLSPEVRAFIKWIKDEATSSEVVGV